MADLAELGSVITTSITTYTKTERVLASTLHPPRSEDRPYLRPLRGVLCARGASISVWPSVAVAQWNKATEQLSFEAASWDWCRMQQRWTDDVSVLPSHPPPLCVFFPPLSVGFIELYLSGPLLLSSATPPTSHPCGVGGFAHAGFSWVTLTVTRHCDPKQPSCVVSFIYRI